MHFISENNQATEFAESLSANRARVFAYVLMHVRQNRTLAEDVTQDCFVQVWRARAHNPPPSGALYTYPVKTARNILRDRHRRQAKVPIVSFEEAPSNGVTTPEAQFVVQETMERIATQMALLPQALRETLHLRVVEGWDYSAIAVYLNCPVGTVRSRLHAARTRIQTALLEQERLHVRETRHPRTVYLHDTHTIYKEPTTMTTANTDTALQARLESVEARLCALEQGSISRLASDSDVWNESRVALAGSLNDERKSKNTPFGFGVYHMVTQVADSGGEGTASNLYKFTSATSLPSDQDLAKRLELMRALTADVAVLHIFRYFYALRFDSKEMRATAGELAIVVGQSAEAIAALLKPLVVNRTLLLVSDGAGTETFEWDGNTPAITTLLFASP